MQYFIVMIDYGKPYIGKKGPSGLEAVVSPEHTRRQIVEEVRDVINSNNRVIDHIKFIDGNSCEDVTSEICTEAMDMEVA